MVEHDTLLLYHTFIQLSITNMGKSRKKTIMHSLCLVVKKRRGINLDKILLFCGIQISKTSFKSQIYVGVLNMYMHIKYHQFFRLAASLLKQKGNLWFKQKFNDKLFTHVMKRMDILSSSMITSGIL